MFDDQAKDITTTPAEVFFDWEAIGVGHPVALPLERQSARLERQILAALRLPFASD